MRDPSQRWPSLSPLPPLHFNAHQPVAYVPFANCKKACRLGAPRKQIACTLSVSAGMHSMYHCHSRGIASFLQAPRAAQDLPAALNPFPKGTVPSSGLEPPPHTPHAPILILSTRAAGSLISHNVGSKVASLPTGLAQSKAAPKQNLPAVSTDVGPMSEPPQ